MGRINGGGSINQPQGYGMGAQAQPPAVPQPPVDPFQEELLKMEQYNQGYKPLYDPFSMSSQSYAKGQLDPLHMDTQGLDKYRQEALRTGPSTWAKLSGQMQDQQAISERSRAAAAAAGAGADARSQLAMRGGLDSGGRMSLAKAQMRNQMQGQQDISQQKGQNMLQIGINDEQNRISQLGQIPGLEAQAMAPQLQKAQMGIQANQFDIGNQVKNASALNDYNSNQYNQKMQAWAANKQANATANAGKKG